MNAKMVSQLFKSFIRPILSYGCENAEYNLNQRRAIKRTEGNILKQLCEITQQCHSTDLFNALDIEPIDNFIDKQTLAFYNRLMLNDLTKEIVESNFDDGDHATFRKIGHIINDSGTSNERVTSVSESIS